MKLFNKSACLSLCAVLAAGTLLVSHGITLADATTQPAASSRSVKEVTADIMACNQKIQAAIGDPKALGSPEKRTAMASTLIPLTQDRLKLVEEYGKVAKVPAGALAQITERDYATLYLLGDKPTVTKVNAMADGDDKVKAIDGQSTRLYSQWLGAGQDVDAQTKLVDAVEKLDAEHTDSVRLTTLTMLMAQTTADKATADRLLEVATEKMQNPMATNIKRQVAMAKKQQEAAEEAQKQMKDMEGKPLEVAGKTVDGKDFSSSTYKGKVVLVDFWATWCPPCRAELPRVKEIYKKYHDQGLEMVGVSNDYSPDTLSKFVEKNDMPWTELYNADAGANHQWNPITQGYGINGIPTMFLIDRSGVLRTVEAREKMEDLIPTLLAEKAPAATPAK